MAHSDDEIERLLAETERALGSSGSSRSPAAPPPGAVSRAPSAFETSVRVSAVSGVIAAAVVFAVFAVLPFLRAISGAAGAFVATFVIVLGQRITGRRKK
ncbi:MAG TPA: hypothetical protein VE081_01005 [Sporichthyaceae bacterium]|nr:hypothetical protein [Sporichthyaceae bacterium]